jgi:low temperature requirement protein LtrA
VSDDHARSRLLAPSRLRTLDDPDEERRANWLELFCALVFVVAVAQLSYAVTRPTAWETYAEIEIGNQQASDHAAVVIDLDV